MAAIQPGPTVKRVMVATDRSESADRAVRWAANLAAAYQAELLLLQVVGSPSEDGTALDAAAPDLDQTRDSLQRFARDLAGDRGLARVVAGDDPTQAILDTVELERVDAVVVGNVGMGGRKQFLLSNIPNQISHNARCTVVIVNSAMLDGAQAPSAPLRGPTDGQPTEGRLLARAWHIGRVMAKAGARDFFTRARSAEGAEAQAIAERFRIALDELGPTFAKLGQILSTRPDLLPPTFIEELASLQERVTPLTEAEVVAAMERELRVPWEDVFGSIDPKPLAAGTIAQVHRATLESGERVVVKVQRPTAEDDILQDLGLLELFASKAASRPAFRRVVDIPAMVEHLSSSLRRELDFRREAGNIRRMAEVLEPFPRLAVPKVYEEYSTARLLVMEEIQGGPVRDAPEGEARTEAARQLLEAYYYQVMSEGFFHADPHPGNMKWWNDRIYFLDMGMVGEVDATVRELVLMILLAFSQGDAGFLSEVVLMLSAQEGGSPPQNLEAFQADLQRLVDRYRTLSLREIQLGPMLQEVSEISVRHTVRVPASLTLMGKAFAQMQLVAAELDPTLDPFSVAESFILRNTLRQIRQNIDPKSLFYELQKARLRITRLMEAVEGTVGARPGSSLQVQLHGTDQIESAIGQLSRRLSLALGLTGAAIGTVMAANSERAPRWLPAALGGLGSLLAAGLLVDRKARK
jgi:ubiquinone biosynthesis protein